MTTARALRIACPTCTAGEGKPCRSTIGTTMTGCHSQRLIAGDRAYLDAENAKKRLRPERRNVSVSAGGYERIMRAAVERRTTASGLVDGIINAALDAEQGRP